MTVTNTVTKTVTETVLAIENVQTFYGHIHALHGISLQVRRGQVVALLGANGAGKSTTLRTISGLVPARSGKVVFEGTDITRRAAHLIPRMGLIHVPEGRRIFKGMTVRENLELGSFTLADEAERQRRLADVFATFPVLDARQHGDASQLSGGEQQMLAIGRALMAGPRLLLLDEPSMGLAPRLVREIMRIIRRLNEAGTTILLVEQNTKIALQVAHYGYVQETGRVVTQGDAASLGRDEAVVKAYLGA
ncbi:MAG TPA: ABC transporter ATP-binding protein [Acetobacteraceae bacterium]|nr:ABC transporter ATP-binding protein [Acetobacteraceae bacterium]